MRNLLPNKWCSICEIVLCAVQKVDYNSYWYAQAFKALDVLSGWLRVLFWKNGLHVTHLMLSIRDTVIFNITSFFHKDW
jgi:hypothetical protein